MQCFISFLCPFSAHGGKSPTKAAARRLPQTQRGLIGKDGGALVAFGLAGPVLTSTGSVCLLDQHRINANTSSIHTAEGRLVGAVASAVLPVVEGHLQG